MSIIPTIINEEFRNFEISGNMPDISFLVGTKKRGLLLFEGKKCTSLIHPPEIYGITKHNNRWWVLCEVRHAEDGAGGHILSFKIKDGKAINYKHKIKGLHNGVHQIDVINNKLYITNTHRNEIFIYDIDTLNKNKPVMPYKRGLKKIAPNGLLNNEKHRYKQENYAHFNSIFAYEGDVYLLAHNITNRTKKTSQIFVLGPKYKIKEKIDTGAWNAHNIYIDDEHFLVCNSIYNKIIDIRKKTSVFKCDKLTRGLAVSQDFILVGGSTNAMNDKSKRNGAGAVYILDKQFNLVCEITIPGAQVNEIRRVDMPDYGMSNSR